MGMHTSESTIEHIDAGDGIMLHRDRSGLWHWSASIGSTLLAVGGGCRTEEDARRAAMGVLSMMADARGAPTG